MCVARCRNATHVFCSFVIILLLKLSFLQQNKHYAGATDIKQFRFRDFEPRGFPPQYSNASYISKTPSNHRKNFETIDATNSEFFERDERGFHIHAIDDDTIVDVEFVVPIMRVPIEGAIQLTSSALQNVLNLRTNSILWVCAFVVIGALVAGAFNTIQALKPALYPYTGYGKRMRDIEMDNNYDVGAMLDEKLIEYNVDLNGCLQKMICNYIQRATDDVRSGKASSSQKIIDGFANTQILERYFSGTAVQISLEAGKTSNCHMLKRSCNLQYFEKNHLLRSFLKSMM